LSVFIFGETFSQNTISLGVKTGASSTNSLFSTSTTTNKYSRTLSIYSVPEIIAAGGTAGIISSLAWEKNGTGEYLFGDIYIKIYLKHRTDSLWPASPVPVWDTEIVNATEVFTSSTYSFPAGTGWKEIVFTNNFTWNGTDHLVVMVEFYRPSTPTAEITWGRSTDASKNATRVGSASLSALVMLINSNRPIVQLTFTTPSDPLTSLTVSTQASVPAVINTVGGTLQMVSTVLPSTANQNVNWSIVPVTGDASISSSGLVTAVLNGTVWAKAVSVQNPSFADSLLITITNQPIPINSVVVSTQGGVPAQISTVGGSLQMIATILPANAIQDVVWSLINVTANASITANGLVTAISNGSVWAKAVSTQDPSKADSMLITITNQPIPVQSVLISTQGSVPAIINTTAGTLQLIAAVLPYTANQNVTWSITQQTGQATISSNGLVSAVLNGTVWAKATSVFDNTKSDSLQITITNQETGINNENSNYKLLLYPNPILNSEVFVEFSKEINYLEVTIFDTMGRLVKTVEINSQKSKVNLQGIESGIYIMKFKNNEIQTERSIIIL